MSRFPSQRHWVGGPPEGVCYPWESDTSHSGDEAALFEKEEINKQRKNSLCSKRLQFDEVCDKKNVHYKAKPHLTSPR